MLGFKLGVFRYLCLSREIREYFLEVVGAEVEVELGSLGLYNFRKDFVG